jgi:anti-sigma factor RsiW
MSEDELEFALSEYHDGTLPAARRAEIEEILRTDPAARRMLEQFARVDAMVRDGAGKLPEIRWNRLAEYLCGAIEEPEEKTSYPIWLYRAVGLAAAAAILVALGLFADFGTNRTANPANPANEVAEVTAPEAPAAAAAEVVDVSIDQPPADSGVAASYAVSDSVLVHRPVISLAGFTPTGGNPIH